MWELKGKKHLNEFSIIIEKGQRLGMFRVAKGEVSINLDPVCRGRGIGNKVLKKFCPKGVWAKIVNGNVPSMKIFLNNGFKITGYIDNYYVLEN